MKMKPATDRHGDYRVNSNQNVEVDGVVPRTVTFIPFGDGQSRVMSMPAEEMMVLAMGADRLQFGAIAIRIGDSAVHQMLSPAELRAVAQAVNRMADLIERQGVN